MFLKNHKRRCFWRCSSKHEKIMQTKHLTRLIAHPYSQKLSVGSGGNSNWNVDYFFSKLQNLKLKADKTLKCPCEAVGLTAVSFSDNKRHMPSRMWPSTKWDRHSDTQTGKAKTFPVIVRWPVTSPGLVLLQRNKNIVVDIGGFAHWARWGDGCHPVWEGPHSLGGTSPPASYCSSILPANIPTTHPPLCCIAQNMIRKPVLRITESHTRPQAR